MDRIGRSGRRMARKLEKWFALSAEQRAWKRRLAHRRHGLPDPQIVPPPPEKIPWKFRTG